MQLSSSDPGTISRFWTDCKSRISARPSLEELAEISIGGLFDLFEDSLILARAFLTIPFESLPQSQRAFAERLAASAGLKPLLQPATPVVTLIGSRGCNEQWNDRTQSREHAAIPLLSEGFVRSIPMISDLLEKFGWPLTWVQSSNSGLQREGLGSETSLFYVEDAGTAIDGQNRKIIGNQDFVSEYGVKTVFAVGGSVFGGAALVLIFFSRHRVDSRTVRVFMPLVNLLKATMISKCSMSKIFRVSNDEPHHTVAQGSASR